MIQIINGHKTRKSIPSGSKIINTNEKNIGEYQQLYVSVASSHVFKHGGCETWFVSYGLLNQIRI
jgi:hypothetical protein